MRLIRIALLVFVAAVSGVSASVAEPVSCQDVRSPAWRDGTPTADLLIRNDSEEPVALVWIDAQGGEAAYGSVAPHAVHWQPSYVGHVWSLRTAGGSCLCALRLTGKTRWMRSADACAQAAIGPYEPTAKYKAETIEGWRVLVSSEFAGHRTAREVAMNALRADLNKIRKRLLPRSAGDLLRQTKIWLELSDPLFPDRAGYHPYADFLAAAGMNPEKLRSVQFTARSLEERARQPAMVLHELAHAFHDQVLGYDDPTILAAYFRSCADERLYKVERRPGLPERHYGLTDQTEFFSEFSETFFWGNDYPPKTPSALAAFDPSIADVIQRSWNKLRAAPVHLGAPHQVCPRK